MEKGLQLSIVIPCFNEEKAIGKVLKGCKEILQEQGLSFELIVVDDFSTDASFKIAKEMGAKVICHTKNLGQGTAIKTGIMNSQAEWILIMDGDSSYAPEDIPLLLEASSGKAQVCGWRQSEKGSLPWVRSLVKKSIKLMISLLVLERIPDYNTGMRTV